MSPEKNPLRLRGGIRNGPVGGQLLVEGLGKQDRVLVIDRSVPAKSIGNARPYHELREGAHGRPMLRRPASREKHQCGLLRLLAQGLAEGGDGGEIEPPFRAFQSEDRLAFHDVAMTGEVKRLERPVQREPLLQELPRSALPRRQGSGRAIWSPEGSRSPHARS